MERGFEEFSGAELDVGMDYAENKLHTCLTREILRVVGNHAGAIRKAQGVVPRVAAVKALRVYEQRNRINISHDRGEAYIRSVAKMLAERNPKTRAKRIRDAEIADIKAAAS